MYQKNDIWSNGTHFVKIHSVLPDGTVLRSAIAYGQKGLVNTNLDVYLLIPKDFKDWKLVERDVKLVEPGRWVPEIGENYYFPLVPNYSTHSMYGMSIWQSDSFGLFRLQHGHVHKTKEEAIAHAQRMLEVK